MPKTNSDSFQSFLFRSLVSPFSCLIALAKTPDLMFDRRQENAYLSLLCLQGLSVFTTEYKYTVGLIFITFIPLENFTPTSLLVYSHTILNISNIIYI